MADDSLALFDLSNDIFPMTKCVMFLRQKPFDDYDEKKFRQRFRLSPGRRGNEYNNTTTLPQDATSREVGGVRVRVM